MPTAIRASRRERTSSIKVEVVSIGGGTTAR